MQGIPRSGRSMTLLVNNVLVHARQLSTMERAAYLEVLVLRREKLNQMETRSEALGCDFLSYARRSACSCA